MLQAVIGKDGSYPEFARGQRTPDADHAALEAVKQWKYKPYFLNGEPVEVDTTINVNFTLAGGK